MNFSKTSLHNFTRKLMDQHNLHDWSIRIGSARNIAGQCNFSRKQITISLFLANAMSTENVTDTILHEIAHALAGHEAGHGDAWKQTCVRIGANPTRTYNESDVDSSKRFKFIGFCPNHNTESYGRNRRSAISCWCGSPFVWMDTENPSESPKPFKPTYVSAIAKELHKYGGNVSTDGVFNAPKGYIWRAEGMHYIDPTLSYYSETDSGRERSASAIGNAVLVSMRDGIEECQCGCINWED